MREFEVTHLELRLRKATLEAQILEEEAPRVQRRARRISAARLYAPSRAESIRIPSDLQTNSPLAHLFSKVDTFSTASPNANRAASLGQPQAQTQAVDVRQRAPSLSYSVSTITSASVTPSTPHGSPHRPRAYATASHESASAQQVDRLEWRTSS